MPTVQNTVQLPDGSPAAGAVIRIDLIAGPVITQPGYTTSASIVMTVAVNASPTGTWSVSLTGNAQITPANTYYRINEAGYISYAVVPASGGPYKLSEVIVAPPTPAPPGITGVQVAANGTVAGVRPEINLVAGTGITLAAADNPGTKAVDVTITGQAVGVPTSRQIATTAPLTGGGDLSADRTLAVSDATTGAKGVVQLAGELAGTAAAPTVPGRMRFRGAWAASTAYAVNDLFTFAGGTFAVTTGFTSGSSFSLANLSNLNAPKNTFNVLWYGAKGDGKSITDLATTSGSTTATSASAGFTAADAGKVITILNGSGGNATLSTTIASVTNATTIVLGAAAGATLTGGYATYGTDDTAAINAAVTAGYNQGVADGTFYANIYFPAAQYMLASATIKGGSTQGNAQIPLPVVGTVGKKFILAFTGGEGASAFAHWQQAVGQTAGAVLQSTLTGLALDGTWLAPSIIGGPTVAQGSGVYSNMRIVVDGITVMAPYNPGIIGMDFRYVAQAEVIKAAALANAGVTSTPGMNNPPATNDLGIGLRMPQNGNNDCAYIVDFACEGFFYGMSIGEHLTALRLALVYVRVGIFLAIGGGSFHGGSITNLSIEAANIGIQTSGTPGAGWPLWIGQMNVESINTDFDDANSVLRGIVYWSNIVDGTPVVSGATGLKILAVTPSKKPGNIAAPAVPSSTTPLLNPFWRDAVVVISGGTVSAIAVDGTATGYTTTGHTVIVPSGKTITLTYSAAPTWTWTAL